MAYEIHLAAFDGPFDLLLHLIQKNEIDIYDIPIADITAQYLEYLAQMEAWDLEIASEFLVMAATLLSIKARMLLPKPPPELLDEEEDWDPRRELVADLLEYRRIKEAAAALGEYYAKRQQLIARPNEESLYTELFSEPDPLGGKTVRQLAAAFWPLWQRAEKASQVHTIRREAVSIGTMTERLLDRLRRRPEGMVFDELFGEKPSRIQVIVGFLALLELSRGLAVKISQSGPDGPIYIMPVDIESYNNNFNNNINDEPEENLAARIS